MEEIALYHLDSLTKIDPAFKNFKYFTNGYIELQKTAIYDTTRVMEMKPDLYIKSPFKDLKIIEDTTFISFNIASKLRRNGSSTTLDIYRFLKIKHEYFVLFRVETGLTGQYGLIIMDYKGNLTRRKIGHYIY